MMAKTSMPIRIGLVLALSVCLNARAADSFLKKLLRITGVSATPSLQKSDEDDIPLGGQIWISNVRPFSSRKITDEAGYRSPVFTPDGQAILAVKSNEIWSVPLNGGAAKKIQIIPGISKLVGFNRDDTNELCLLRENNGQTTVSLLALASGQITALPHDPQDVQARRAIAHLQAWEREYSSSMIYTEIQRKKSVSGEIEWTDVFLKVGDADPVNVSKGEGVNCGQPSLSARGDQVAFIKATRRFGR